MDRRRFLQAASVAGIVGLSRCQEEEDVSDQGTHTDEGSESGSDAKHGSESEDKSEPDPEDEDEADEAIESVYYVATDGSDSNSGSPENPLASIQEALERAHPGDTVEVQSGEYFESYAHETD